MKDISEINWSVIDGMDVDSGVNLWNTLFSNVANSHAPIKKTRIKGMPAPWMTSALSQLMRDRDYHHTKAVKSNSKHHWLKYRKPVLTKLFHRSIDSSVFPAIWKQGKVTALFKSGDKSDCNNYRPITVLPTVSKILERAVH